MRRRPTRLEPDPTNEGCRVHELAVSWRAKGKFGPGGVFGSAFHLTIFEKASGPHHGDSHQRLEQYRRGSGNMGSEHERAVKLYQRSVRTMEKIEEERRTGTAPGAIINRAWQRSFEFRDATGKQSLSLCRPSSWLKKSFGPGDPEVSMVLNNLAVLYKYTGRFIEAGGFTDRLWPSPKRFWVLTTRTLHDLSQSGRA